ncbi:MAG: hypothetical protein GY754_03185 [bacterium]|nr:hypothetical protein [bacterium]
MNKTLKLSTILIIILALFLAGCNKGCGLGSGGGGNGGDNDIDTTPPTVLTISSVSGSTISLTDNIVITFSESMAAGTILLNGDLSLEAGFTWSTTTYENDTLTLSPFTDWSVGDDLTLDIDCEDFAGNEMDQLNLVYTIESVWAGTQQLGGERDEYVRGMAADNFGNIYVVGYTYYDLDGNTNAGKNDFFLIKYNSSGEKQWTRLIGTVESDTAHGVATDNSGNIYVTGYTFGDFDGNTNAGERDFFVVKFNSSGETQWTRQMGTDMGDNPQGISIDSSGNIYVAGYTYGDLDGNTNAGQSDVFLVKYNSLGEKQWTRQMGTDRSDSPKGVSTDSYGNIYVVGSTGGDLDGNTNAGCTDFFLVKYNSSGEKQWTRQLGTVLNEFANGVSINSSGNIYVAGRTGRALDGNTWAGKDDMFLAKYNSSGEKQWTRQLGTELHDQAHGVATDNSGNIYITGNTEGGLDGEINSGGTDIVVVKYNSSGEKQWTRQMGSDSDDCSKGVATDSSGNIYITGNTEGGLDGNTNIGSFQNYDIFLVKYNSIGEKQ